MEHLEPLKLTILPKIPINRCNDKRKKEPQRHKTPQRRKSRKDTILIEITRRHKKYLVSNSPILMANNASPSKTHGVCGIHSEPVHGHRDKFKDSECCHRGEEDGAPHKKVKWPEKCGWREYPGSVGRYEVEAANVEKGVGEGYLFYWKGR